MDTVPGKSIAIHYDWWLIAPGELHTGTGRLTIAVAVCLPCARQFTALFIVK